MKKKIFIGIGIFALLLVFIAAAVINSKKTETFAKNAVPVQFETVKNSTIVSKVTATGNIQLEDKESIYVDMPMKVKNVFVKQGDTVKKGQVLIQYDNNDRDDMLYQLETAKNTLQIAQLDLLAIAPGKSSDYDFTHNQTWVYENEEIKQLGIKMEQALKELEKEKETVENNRVLYEAGGISSKEFKDFQNSLKTKEADVELYLSQKRSAINKLLNQAKAKQNDIKTAKLKIKELESKLRSYALESISPVSGTVISLGVEKGQKVDITQPAVQIADMGKLIVKVDIPEFDAPDIAVGQEAKLSLESDEYTFYKGVVKKISPIAVIKRVQNQESPAVEIEVSILDKSSKLKEGYSANTEIITSKKDNVPVVPILSVLKDKDGKEYVYIIKNDNSIEKRIVKTGTYSELFVEVSNVKAGEKIISNPTNLIKEGIFVKPITVKNTN